MRDEGVNRRRALTLLGGLAIAPGALAQVAGRVTPFAPVVPGYRMRFPHDEGSHPEFRTEWWYVTGWLESGVDQPLGFQITFFRTRPRPADGNPSAFSPRHIMVAHAALSDPRVGRLQHDARVARAALDLAGAEPGQLHVWLDNWSLRRESTRYLARIPARDFTFDFSFSPTQAALLQGESGYSRKGPQAGSASYYYSLPHLAVEGRLQYQNRSHAVRGRAWMDHEWSSNYMEENASGWDWVGLNLDDGSALMLFHMRDRQRGRLWAGGTYRNAAGKVRALDAHDIQFKPLRLWRSFRSGATYPVSWEIRIADIALEIDPLMDDQEYDARLSTGTIYWEGAVRALQHGQPAGSGYLELTGYWRPMQL